MASVRQQGGSWLVCFRYAGKQFQRAVTATDGRDAAGVARLRAKEVDALMWQLKQGFAKVPDNADVGEWLFTGGRAVDRNGRAGVGVSLAAAKASFLKSQVYLRQAKTTQLTTRIHLAKIEDVLGGDRALAGLSYTDVQGYVDARAEAGDSPVTIRKEIGTLSSMWNLHAKPQGIVSVTFQQKIGTLQYPKGEEKLPFRPLPKEVGDLTKCPCDYYLNLDDLGDVLQLMGSPNPPWLCAAGKLAMDTGCRRSEILRAELADFDLDEAIVLLREKKRKRSMSLSFRMAPLTDEFVNLFRKWLKAHPGGRYAFCATKDKPLAPSSIQEAFERAFKGTRFAALKGWHSFRHSFCSNHAEAGVDQRVIDAIVGHQTEEMRQRYRHFRVAALRKIHAATDVASSSKKSGDAALAS